FDHGASVVTAVSVRATFTTLVLFTMMRLQGVSLGIPRELRGRTFLAGLLIATQSYCLYSAVALIPPALALLVFQTSPMLYVLLTWALGRAGAAAGACRLGRTRVARGVLLRGDGVALLRPAAHPDDQHRGAQLRADRATGARLGVPRLHRDAAAARRRAPHRQRDRLARTT